jgi:hypothetical protein
MTIKDILMCSKNPAVKDAMERFDKEPWNFNVFSPINLEDDPAVISVNLYIGTTSKAELKIIHIFIHNGECVLIR